VGQIRQTIDDISRPIPSIHSTEDNLHSLRRDDWKRSFLRKFSSEEFKADSDYVKVICYSNKRVAEINQTVREKIHGMGVDEYLIGERVICRSSYSSDEQVIMSNGEEGEIVDINEGTIADWKVWFLTLAIDGKAELVDVPVIQECERQALDDRLKMLSDMRSWLKYWNLREMFADIRHSYAITGHSSQGSTYQHVYLDLNNFVTTFHWICKRLQGAELEQKIRERNQLIYTAASRSAEQLYVLE
jgi:exodeoxyribonuclease-5